MTNNINNSGIVQVRLSACQFTEQNSRKMLKLEAHGWRFFLRKSSAGELLTWIMKRGASAVMLVQSRTSAQIQMVSMPSTEDARELCNLFMQAGLAQPV